MHNLPKKLSRSFIFDYAISWETNSNSENKWPLLCAPFGIWYFKVAYEAQVQEIMTQEFRIQICTWSLVFVKFVQKNHKILVCFYFKPNKIWMLATISVFWLQKPSEARLYIWKNQVKNEEASSKSVLYLKIFFFLRPNLKIYMWNM